MLIVIGCAVDDDVAVDDDDDNEEVAVAIHGAHSRRANPTDYIKCCPARIAIITNIFVVIFVIMNLDYLLFCCLRDPRLEFTFISS